MISETLEIVAQVGILVFVVTSMLSVGMSVTLAQVVTPLRNGRLLGGVLLGNFVAVPALAVLLTASYLWIRLPARHCSSWERWPERRSSRNSPRWPRATWRFRSE